MDCDVRSELTKTFLAGETIDIGDERLSYFSPYVKVRKWGDECSFSLRYPTLAKNDIVVENGKHLWTDGKINLAIYPKAAVIGKDDGSLEIEATFYQCPENSYLDFEIDSTNIEFYLQTPLNQQLDVIAHHQKRAKGYTVTADETHIYGKNKVLGSCPDYIPYSYSLFHSTKKQWHRSLSDALKYKWGKIGSIRRPKLTDALGNVSWCMMSIKDGLLRVEMDMAWLKAATYPVILDPDYGMTTTPAYPDSEYLNGSECFVAELGTAPADGTMNQVHAYLDCDSGTNAAIFGLYNSSGSNPNSRISIEPSSTVTITTTAGWFNSTTDQNQAMTSGATYWAGVQTASAVEVFIGYDTTGGSGYEGYFDNVSSLPASWTDLTYGKLTDKRCAFHVTYTAGGSALTKSLSDTLSISSALSNAVSKPRSDTMSISDVRAKAIGIPQTDAFAIADSLSNGIGKPNADSMSIADSLINDVGKSRVDTVTIADDFTRVVDFDRTLSDLVSILDSLSNGIGKPLTDALSIADSINVVRFLNVILNDTMTIGDALSKGIELSKSDTITLADSLVKYLGLGKADSISIADSLSKAFSNSQADLMGITDSPVKSVSIIQADLMAIADIFDRVVGFTRSLSESLSINENISKAVDKVKSDTVIITDSFFRVVSWTRSLSDSLGITDSLIKSFGAVNSEIVAINESITKAFGKVKADTLAITDSLVAVLTALTLTLNLFDTVVITDSVTAYHCVKTWVKQQVSRMNATRMQVSRMGIQKINDSRMSLWRYICRRVP